MVMRRCTIQRRSVTSKCFTTRLSRSFSSKGPAQDVAPFDGGGSEASAQQLTAQDGNQASAEDPDGETAGLKNRELSLNYRRRGPLPLSPLMDPAYQAAREKYSQPKAPQRKTEERTPFQRELYANPYAQALATPVRRCSVTRICLPKFFLQDFELMTHPKTNESWYLPNSLASSKSKSKSQPEAVDAHSSAPSPAPPAPPAPSSPSQDPSSAPSAESQPPAPKPSSTSTSAISKSSSTPTQSPALPLASPRRGPKAYTISSHLALQALSDKKSGFFRAWLKFPLNRARSYRYTFKPDTFRWREDMDSFVLELMRRRTVERLRELLILDRGSRKSKIKMRNTAQGVEGHEVEEKEKERLSKGGNVEKKQVEYGIFLPVKGRGEEALNAMRSTVGPGDVVLWIGPHSSTSMTKEKNDGKEYIQLSGNEEQSPSPSPVETTTTPSSSTSMTDLYPTTTGEAPITASASAIGPVPGEFATLNLNLNSPSSSPSTSTTATIPVHNLSLLLGDNHLNHLKELFLSYLNATDSDSKSEYIIMRPSNSLITGNSNNQTNKISIIMTDVSMWFWKLQGYVARFGGFDDERQRSRKKRGDREGD